MAQNIRQSKLFAAEDYVAVYELMSMLTYKHLIMTLFAQQWSIM